MEKVVFDEAVAHQTRVLSEIQKILREHRMSLHVDGGDVCLHDDGRDIGYTGFILEDK
jgi:hypothetical protein